jgi:transposase
MKEPFLHLSVGIDVAKSDFKVCLMGLLANKQTKIVASSSFTNRASGWEDFWQWVQKHCQKLAGELKPQFLLEATGVYHENLAWFLYEQQAAVVIVLPNQAKSFFRSEGFKSKNDKIDAAGLAKMSLSKNLRLWQPISPILHRLRTLTRHYSSLQKEITRMGNQLHALEHSHQIEKTVKAQLEKILILLAEQKAETMKNILKLLKEDKDLSQKLQHLTSIHGVGILTAATVIAETNGFLLFTNQKQLTSFAGYDIIENESGTHIGKTKISKKGNSHLRRILHMASLQAMQVAGVFQDLHQRVFERTKIKMKAYVAVQRKLLCIMYTLWKKEENFDAHKPAKKIVEEPEALLPEIVPN